MESNQFVKLLSRARGFAVDVSENCLQVASEVGADEVVRSDDDAAEEIMSSTAGRGCDAIIDLVGSDQTLLLATKISRPRDRDRLCWLARRNGEVRAGSMCNEL